MALWSWLTRRRTDLDEDDFEEEIRTHLAMAERDQIEGGADRDAARHAARKDFGNVTLTTEAARRVWTPRWLDALRDFTDDVRYAVRSLAKTPAFSLIVVGVLMVGTTLNATVFTLLKSLALTPLPGVEGSAKLHVVVRETRSGGLRLSYPDFKFLREHDQAFTGLMGAMFQLEQYRLGKGAGTSTASVEFVTGNYFEVLGVTAALGRTLQPADETAPGADPVVVIGHGLWQREYGSDPGIVGRTIEINRYPMTIVGVAEAGFHGTIPLYDNELFIPITMAADIGVINIAGVPPGASSAALLTDPDASVLAAHGFLRPGVAPAAAAEQTAALWDARPHKPSLTEGSERPRIVPFWRSPIGPQTYAMPMFGTLTVMGCLVLLIACANIAGLVLARGVSRRGELAARLALGASRPRIVRLLTLETLVLVVPGTALGILVAQRAAGAFFAFLEGRAAPQRVFLNTEIDALTIGFAALVAALCALVFGFLPAVQTSRVDLVAILNEDASPRGASRGRLRAGLVAAQVAVSLVLLVSAGLVTRSLDQMAGADVGYDDTGVMVFPLDLQQNRYDEPRARAFYRGLLESLQRDPSVESASLSTTTPLGFLDPFAAPLAVDGYAARPGEELNAPFNVIAPDYFRTLQIDLVAGREFDRGDTETGLQVAIVNRTLADRLLGGAGNALGKRIRSGDGGWRTVVGVAADVKYTRISEAPRPYVYLPLEQAYQPTVLLQTRGAGDGTALAPVVRAHIAAIDRDLPPPGGQPLSDFRRIALLLLQMAAAAMFVFGSAGMLLAGMGTYGLVSYTVAQQTREIGIRMALGATAPAVVRAFIERSLRLAASGAAAGLFLAVGATRFLRSLLYGVSATDGLSFAAALAIVLVGVLLATLVPALRAARTNPLVALRHN